MTEEKKLLKYPENYLHEQISALIPFSIEYSRKPTVLIQKILEMVDNQEKIDREWRVRAIKLLKNPLEICANCDYTCNAGGDCLVLKKVLEMLEWQRRNVRVMGAGQWMCNNPNAECEESKPKGVCCFFCSSKDRCERERKLCVAIYDPVCEPKALFFQSGETQMSEQMSVREQVQKKALLEKLAELEHEQWAHWIRYQQSRTLYIERKGELEKWLAQSQKDYEELSEKEKESDREWARKVLAIIKDSHVCVPRKQLEELIEHWKKQLPLMNTHQGRSCVEVFVYHLNRMSESKEPLESEEKQP